MCWNYTVNTNYITLCYRTLTWLCGVDTTVGFICVHAHKYTHQGTLLPLFAVQNKNTKTPLMASDKTKLELLMTKEKSFH